MSDPNPNTSFRTSLHGLPYDETAVPKPPLRNEAHQSSARTPLTGTNTEPKLSVHSLITIGTQSQDQRNLSRKASAQDSPKDVAADLRTPISLNSSQGIPEIRVEKDNEKSTDKKWLPLKSSMSDVSENKPEQSFRGLALNIPSGNLGDEFGLDQMKFSKRGSILMSGKKGDASNGRQAYVANVLTTDAPKKRPVTEPRPRPSTKILSTDEEHLSQKVRSFYVFGTEAPTDNDGQSSIAQRIGQRWREALGPGTEVSSVESLSRATSTTDVQSEIASQQNGDSKRSTVFQREENELAGGIEDWQDVDNADVDRYGFIIPKIESSNGLNRSPTTKDSQRMTRVTTSLQLASETPRRKGTVRRAPSSAHGKKSGDLDRSPSAASARPASSPSGTLGRRPTLRSRNKKVMDEAGDMLTLPRTAPGQNDPTQTASDDPRARRKEVEREEKWLKMAKPSSTNKHGGGMTFEFDVTDPKLIERTWKGIPDKWRATAWHAFLTASAKKQPGSLSDEELIGFFHEYQNQPCSDDVQIDIDVPRTISSHIMFRRRYRGGQRLLFRVLHAMSLHFGDTGYVQGMAALAATLLAYYEEEKAFIMLVRLWELRGLEKLYKPGFAGLMAALDDFEKSWLGSGELAKKLTDVNITPTAYGTRWYLTLFNYSIPFPAQLRVWDVFMLLGNDPTVAASDETSFGTTLDILHATSAALIDGMREILLDSDFENAMKVLTSWIPIRDEDLLMRVAKAEWKVHKKKT